MIPIRLLSLLIGLRARRLTTAVCHSNGQPLLRGKQKSNAQAPELAKPPAEANFYNKHTARLLRARAHPLQFYNSPLR